jgi:hypothetical protein
MKTISKILLLIVAFSITTFTAFAEDTKVGHFFRVKSNIYHQFQECDAKGNTEEFTTKVLPATSKFTIVDKLTGGDYIIKFWEWENIRNMRSPTDRKTIVTNTYLAPVLQNTTDKAESFNFRVKDGNWDIRYFRITAVELELYAEELQSWLMATGGIATMPFKYRWKNDFSKDLTLSNLGGIIHRFPNNVNLSALLGIGISSVTLDSANTEGEIRKAADFAALTISFGLVVEFQRLQIGVFTGWDHLTASSRNNWIYQGKNWIAVGIGFALFSESNSRSEEGKNNN